MGLVGGESIVLYCVFVSVINIYIISCVFCGGFVTLCLFSFNNNNKKGFCIHMQDYLNNIIWCLINPFANGNVRQTDAMDS